MAIDECGPLSRCARSGHVDALDHGPGERIPRPPDPAPSCNCPSADGKTYHQRAWLAERLRRFADRIDHAGSPKYTGRSFTFEDGVGIVFHDDLRGCPIVYLGDEDYKRAHNPLWDTASPNRPTED